MGEQFSAQKPRQGRDWPRVVGPILRGCRGGRMPHFSGACMPVGFGFWVCVGGYKPFVLGPPKQYPRAFVDVPALLTVTGARGGV